MLKNVHVFCSKKIKFSLSILLLGVGIASVTDLQLNLVGTILSLLAIITTCIGQIVFITLTSFFQLTSKENIKILTYAALISADKHNPEEIERLLDSAALSVSPIPIRHSVLDWPFCRPVPHETERLRLQLLPNRLSKLDQEFKIQEQPFSCIHSYFLFLMQGFIVLSCLIAVFVNFSTFLVIGKTSPVTYQVLGHLKTCLVLGFGYTLLHDPFTSRNIVGILIAVVGMGLYSYFCTNETKRKQVVDVSSLPPVPPPLFFNFCTRLLKSCVS